MELMNFKPIINAAGSKSQKNSVIPRSRLQIFLNGTGFENFQVVFFDLYVADYFTACILILGRPPNGRPDFTLVFCSQLGFAIEDEFAGGRSRAV